MYAATEQEGGCKMCTIKSNQAERTKLEERKGRGMKGLKEAYGEQQKMEKEKKAG
jgi:hypothetical protein